MIVLEKETPDYSQENWSKDDYDKVKNLPSVVAALEMMDRLWLEGIKVKTSLSAFIIARKEFYRVVRKEISRL